MLEWVSLGAFMYNIPEQLEFCPQNIEWNGYVNKPENNNQYVKLARDTRKQLLKTIAPWIKLYSLPTKYFVLDEQNAELLYLVELKTEFIKSYTAISQLKVWRNRVRIETQGLASEIFFAHILPSADLVISDGEHTADGRAFWQLRVAAAFAQGLNVYLCDLNHKTFLKLDTVEDFGRNAPKYYSDEAYRLAISTKPL